MYGMRGNKMTAEEGTALLEIYENYFGNEIDKESDTWKTFKSIMIDRPTFYNLIMEEILPRCAGAYESVEANDEQVKMDEEFIESVSHLAWLLWEGNRPDEKPLGETKWGTLADMFIQMKGLEIKHYG